ncbi:MAG: HipA N-terminal domain-containing protein [Oscillospiraceae bacterium]|nr:HipA N-terminal domain-containing protein [Oscillospiraceae bacterium]
MNKKLEVYWQEPQKHERFMIGTLSYCNEMYIFKYVKNFEELRQKGFCEIFPFLDSNQVYSSHKMFSVFSSRLPDAKQIGIEKILKKYNLTSYDEFELLARSGGRVPRDTLEFIVPIDENTTGIVKFYIAGVSHCCCKKDISLNINIPINSLLQFQLEPQNQYDTNAIFLTYNNNKIGYIPKYYSEGFTKIIKKGKKVSIKVSENHLNTCNSLNECRLCIGVDAEII